jgi:hypothetical protein
MITTSQLIQEINNTHERSAWLRGVNQYAVELAANVGEVVGDWQNYSFYELETIALNGATDWAEYSEGGCTLVYDCDICERLATPSEIKRTRHGELDPNAYESWIDVQTRALMQAWDYIEFVLHYKFGMPLD